MDDERHEAREIGRRLREERERHGMSQIEVARMTGVPARWISYLEVRGIIGLAYLANLADLYGVCPGELFGAVCGEVDATPVQLVRSEDTPVYTGHTVVDERIEEGP